jgi:hypothetical protein
MPHFFYTHDSAIFQAILNCERYVCSALEFCRRLEVVTTLVWLYKQPSSTSMTYPNLGLPTYRRVGILQIIHERSDESLMQEAEYQEIMLIGTTTVRKVIRDSEVILGEILVLALGCVMVLRLK